MNKTFMTSWLASEANPSFPAGFNMVGKNRPCTDHQPCCKNRGLKKEFQLCGSTMLQRFCTCHEGTL